MTASGTLVPPRKAPSGTLFVRSSSFTASVISSKSYSAHAFIHPSASSALACEPRFQQFRVGEASTPSTYYKWRILLQQIHPLVPSTTLHWLQPPPDASKAILRLFPRCSKRDAFVAIPVSEALRFAFRRGFGGFGFLPGSCFRSTAQCRHCSYACGASTCSSSRKGERLRHRHRLFDTVPGRFPFEPPSVSGPIGSRRPF